MAMKKWILPIICAAALLLCVPAARYIQADMQSGAQTALHQAILDAAVQCCAIEGTYPASVAYLEENYGLVIDHDRYIVQYEVFASNILPEIQIIQK